MTLMKAGLLGRASGRTNGATVGAGEIYALISESIEIWGFYVRKPLGLPFGLTVRPDGAPTHVIYIEIENIGSRGVVCFSADGRC